MLIDAHAHLNLEQLFINWKEYLQAFQDVGGKILINAGAHEDYNRNGIFIAQEAKKLFPDLVVKATIGYHPRDAKDIPRENYHKIIAELEQQYLQHSEDIVAIGEGGIDLYGSDNPPLADQQELFREQLVLARKLQLPIVIHSRDAFDETVEVLKEFSDLKMYFHCRGY